MHVCVCVCVCVLNVSYYFLGMPLTKLSLDPPPSTLHPPNHPSTHPTPNTNNHTLSSREKSVLKQALADLPSSQRAALTRMAGRIRAFATAQRAAITDVTVDIPGGRAGHRVQAVRTAGCYAPGGRYPLPSSVLMTAITARVAGVEQVWVASPNPAPATLAAAHLAGVDGFIWSELA